MASTDPSGPGGAQEPRRVPPSPPGAKRAQHRRRVRVAAAATAAAVLGFGAFAVFGWHTLSTAKTERQRRAEGCATFLGGIANQVRSFADRQGRLPRTLAEMFSPDSPSPYDAEPADCWHRAVEYRVVDEGAREFRLRSLGPDGKPDSDDDIVWPDDATWK